MTDTPVPLRELAAAAVTSAARCDHPGAESCDPWWIADAVLAAVEPVIRRQVAQEIATKIEAKSTAAYNGEFGYNDWDTGLVREGLDDAAAIARSHSTQPTEEETTNGR